MNVTGLDLSITATGICYPDGRTHTIQSRRTGDHRLLVIQAAILDIAENICDLAVIEDLPTHAHGAGITGMVHGTVRPVLLSHDVPYVLVPPASLKKFATGKGNATKADMRMALFQRATLDIRDDNQVDAWWLRAMALDYYGQPVVQVPQSHRVALAKVAWPDIQNKTQESQ